MHCHTLKQVPSDLNRAVWYFSQKTIGFNLCLHIQAAMTPIYSTEKTGY
jgi:hypothetical protein